MYSQGFHHKFKEFLQGRYEKTRICIVAFLEYVYIENE